MPRQAWRRGARLRCSERPAAAAESMALATVPPRVRQAGGRGGEVGEAVDEPTREPGDAERGEEGVAAGLALKPPAVVVATAAAPLCSAPISVRRST